MFTDEELEMLEEEEYQLSVEQFALLVLLLNSLNKDVEKELALFYKKYGKDDVVTYQQARKRDKEKDNRIRVLMLYEVIAKSFDDSFIEFEENFKRTLISIVKRESEFFGVDVDIEGILATPWKVDEATWNERLYAYRNKWVSVLSNDLKQHFLKHSTFQDVIDSVGDRFESMEKILWKLYTTESTAINSLARHQIFKEMGVKKYRYYTRADERRCEECGALHGLIFPLSAFEPGVTASPLHPYCRCWEVPIVE